MKKLINKVVKNLLMRRISRIESFMRNPEKAQQEQFKKIIRGGENTEYGKKYAFNDIKNEQIFAERVPLVAYEELFPFIEKMLHGEQNILWNKPVSWFSKSSGTTNARSKFIPVSNEFLQNNHYRGGKDMYTLFCNNYPETEIFAGKILGVGGSLDTNPAYPSIRFGDVSAVMMKNLPFWAEHYRTPSLQTALMPHWESKLPQLAQEVLRENVTAIQGVPTWIIFLIKKVVEISGKKNITEVWENFECFFHGAVAFDPYRPLFQELVPSEKMKYSEVFNASEGFFAVQDQKDHSDLLLLLDNEVYYEFIPIEDAESPTAKAIPLMGVELNKIYSMVISTNGGLWRYKIGDTVRFTSISPYRLRIAGRTKQFINAFGEELMVHNADEAVSEACRQTGAIFSEYTAAPVFIANSDKGCHEWLFEFEKMPNDMVIFSKVLDENLRKHNSDYDAKRTADIALTAPKIHVLQQGRFYEWMRKRGKLGGQHKVPRLSNSREYVEELLKM